MRTLAEMGKEVARLRKERGWTQTELGAEVGMGQSTIARLEGGRVPEFGTAKMLKLLLALGYELNASPVAPRSLRKGEDQSEPRPAAAEDLQPAGSG